MPASAGSGARAGAALDVVAPVLQYGLSDSGSPGIVKSFLGDRRVAGHLALENFLHFGEVHSGRVVKDPLQCHLGPVSFGLVVFLMRRSLLRYKDGLSVLLDLRDIRVVLFNSDRSFVVLIPHLCFDVQIGHIFRQRHVADPGFHQFARLFAGFVIRVRDDFQHLVGVSAHDAEHRCRLDSLHSSGVGHGDALHVFYNISGAGDPDVVRHHAQFLISFRGGISNGDRLRTSHRRDKLFL